MESDWRILFRAKTYVISSFQETGAEKDALPKIIYPSPAEASLAPAGSSAVGGGGLRVVPLLLRRVPPTPPFPRQCSTVSIWATDNHHANLGLQTLSINLGANRTEPLFLLGFFAAIISDNQTFFFHAQAQAQKV